MDAAGENKVKRIIYTSPVRRGDDRDLFDGCLQAKRYPHPLRERVENQVEIHSVKRNLDFRVWGQLNC